MNLNLGIHLSVPIDIIPSVKIGNSLQLMFNKNKLNNDDIKNIKKILITNKKNNYKFVFIHSSYLINIASDFLTSSNNELYNPGLEILLYEISIATKLKVNGIVVHLGKNVKEKTDPDIVYNNMVNFMLQIFKILSSKNIHIKILLETPAGQKGDLCYNLDQFVNFILLFKNTDYYKYIGICIDTCHIFQAGYDLNDDGIIKKVHSIFEPVKEKIMLIHLNNSFYPFNSHIDRHEQLDKGYIKINKLIKFIYAYKDIPMILETSPPYEKQINLLNKK